MAGKTAEEKKELKVVIADASSFVRLILSDILAAEPGITVVATAISGHEALKQVKLYKPDVLLMDLDLPQNMRSYALQRIAADCPVPVLLMSNREHIPADELLKLRMLGVYDLVQKPANILQPQLRGIGRELVQKLIAAHKVQPEKQKQALQSQLQQQLAREAMHISPLKVVVLGASTGGTRQIEMLVQWLSASFMGSLLVAVHLPAAFAESFVKRLKGLTPLKVKLAKSGTRLEAGQILVAPGGRDMVVREVPGIAGAGRVLLTGEPDSHYDAPSIDRLMISAAGLYKKDTIGVILTGMGNDGTEGMAAISEAGGVTIVQEHMPAGVFGMAMSAMRSGVAHQVLPLSLIVSYIESQTIPETGEQEPNLRMRL